MDAVYQTTTFAAGLLPAGFDGELYFAYLMLEVLAVVPIYAGAWAGLKLKSAHDQAAEDSDAESDDEDEEDEDYFSFDDARWFPVMGSATLLGLYMVIKFVDRRYLDYLITAYFSVLGVVALSQLFLTTARKLLHRPFRGDYHLAIHHRPADELVLSYNFGPVHIACMALALLLTVYYVISSHWVVSNLYGEAFALTAVQLFRLDSFATGILLLSGLFLYDIFWVFGTDVMVTVARNFNAPIKVVWPKNILAVLRSGHWWHPTPPPGGMDATMLGLGDIVIPGVFIALCLVFDQHLYRQTPRGKLHRHAAHFPRPYFITCMIAYVVGLTTTIFIMHTFRAAQPALLYLSPACILSVLLTAFIRGDLKTMMAFRPQEMQKKASKTAVDVADGDVDGDADGEDDVVYEDEEGLDDDSLVLSDDDGDSIDLDADVDADVDADADTAPTSRRARRAGTAKQLRAKAAAVKEELIEPLSEARAARNLRPRRGARPS